MKPRTAINVALLAIGTAVLLSQTSVQDYLLSRSPGERLMNHAKEFEKKVARDPEIRRALEEPSLEGRSERLQEMSRRGIARLDDATLIERARIMGTLYGQLSERMCAKLVRGGEATETDTAELHQALIRLGRGFVQKWMDCTYKAILAEARQSPKRIVTREEVAAAFESLEQKVGKVGAMRVDAGMRHGASDAEICDSAKTIYAVAPKLPAPQGATLLRYLTQGVSDTNDSIPALTPDVH